jgi:sulfoxide reductase heme-binding subunit YedZ
MRHIFATVYSQWVTPAALVKGGMHLAAWLPLAWLVFDFWNGSMINPVQEITQRTGLYALILLIASLACTPANTLLGWRQAINLRRPLGLYAFGYALLHFLSFTGLDYAFQWALLNEAIFQKPYVFIGMLALFILLALAVTSFPSWMKRLGKNWKRLHRLVHLAGMLVIIHFAWSVKGDFLRLQGDVGQPLAFGIALALLLSVRLPVVRRALSAWRSRRH